MSHRHYLSCSVQYIQVCWLVIYPTQLDKCHVTDITCPAVSNISRCAGSSSILHCCWYESSTHTSLHTSSREPVL